MVDGASDRDGTGGKTRTVLQGLRGWITNLFGKQIFIGDYENQSIQIGAHGNGDGTVTILLTGKRNALNDKIPLTTHNQKIRKGVLIGEPLIT
jgi:hypothetical protein